MKPEESFQRTLVQFAQARGWHIAHFRCVPVWRGNHITYQTPTSANGNGFPDLVLARDRVVFAELKTQTGRLRPDQQVWRGKLLAAGAEHYVWDPRDWDEIRSVLM